MPERKGTPITEQELGMQVLNSLVEYDRLGFSPPEKSWLGVK
jgi:hypothetical protein